MIISLSTPVFNTVFARLMSFFLTIVSFFTIAKPQQVAPTVLTATPETVKIEYKNNTGKVIEPEMRATVYPDGYNQQEYGHMSGSVTYVDEYVTSIDEMRQLLEEDTVVNAMAQSGPVVLVVVKLDEDSSAANKYLWSNPEGGNLDLRDGSLCSVTIVTESKRPIEEFF